MLSSAWFSSTPGGSPGQALILDGLRHPPAAGKSTAAAEIRSRHGRGIAIVGQDHLRRIVLRERHAAKSQASEYGRTEMRGWYREQDVLPGGYEQIIGEDASGAHLGAWEHLAHRDLAASGV